MKTYSYYCIVIASILFLCCTCSYGKIPRKTKPNLTAESILNVQVDDSVSHFLGDTLSQIIFGADTVKLLSLSVKPANDSLDADSLQNDSIQQPCFHGCYVKHNYGVLLKSEIFPVLLILSDRDNYIVDNLRLKSPFIPDAALSFKKGDNVVDIVFSFTGGQMYIFTDYEKKIYVKYTYERLMMKYFNTFLKDERITEFLNK